jgi:hypothetical protein
MPPGSLQVPLQSIGRSTFPVEGTCGLVHAGANGATTACRMQAESPPPTSVRTGPVLLPVAGAHLERANRSRSSWIRATCFRDRGHPTEHGNGESS